MLKNLYKKGYFNYRNFILENLKGLSLSTSEAIVLICLLDEVKETGKVSITNLTDKILMKKNEIENVLASLLDRKFYSFYLSTENGIEEERVSLEGFFLKASHILEHDDSKDDELYKVTSYVEEVLNRNLTSSELDILSSLVLEDYYTLKEFEASLKLLEKRKTITFKLIVSHLRNNDTTDIKPSETPEYVTEFIKKLKKS